MTRTSFKKATILAVSAILTAAMFLTGCSLPASSQTSASLQPSQAVAQPAAVLPDIAIDADGNKIIVNKLSVNATGKVKVMPDVAYVSMGVTTQNKSMKKAQSDNKTKMNAVFDALEKGGLTKDDIRTTNYSLNPTYDYTTGNGVITGYEAVNTIELTVKDLDKIGDYIDIAAGAGANSNYSITFDLLDRDASYNQALTEAMKTAKAKADALAAAGGYTITGVLEVSEGSYNYVPEYTNGAKGLADAVAPTPINAGQLDVTATVTAVYQIK